MYISSITILSPRFLALLVSSGYKYTTLQSIVSKLFLYIKLIIMKS